MLLLLASQEQRHVASFLAKEGTGSYVRLVAEECVTAALCCWVSAVGLISSHIEMRRVSQTLCPFLYHEWNHEGFAQTLRPYPHLDQNEIQ